MKIDKCYLFGKEFYCEVEYDEESFSLQFGDGELFDKEGDSYYIYCYYDFFKEYIVIQIVYEDFYDRVYYEEVGKEMEIKDTFLQKDTIFEIVREFKENLQILKNEILQEN